MLFIYLHYTTRGEGCQPLNPLFMRLVVVINRQICVKIRCMTVTFNYFRRAYNAHSPFKPFLYLFGFLFLWGSRKWKSDNHKDRWIQLILFTVFNTLEGMLFSLVLLSLPNLTRMHILFSLFWLFALNSQYLAATSYQEGPVALSQKEKGTFIFSALFFRKI